jgi:hypothetical protein
MRKGREPGRAEASRDRLAKELESAIRGVLSSPIGSTERVCRNRAPPKFRSPALSMSLPRLRLRRVATRSAANAAAPPLGGRAFQQSFAATRLVLPYFRPNAVANFIHIFEVKTAERDRFFLSSGRIRAAKVRGPVFGALPCAPRRGCAPARLAAIVAGNEAKLGIRVWMRG